MSRGDAATVSRAAAVRALLRERRPSRLRPSAFQIYGTLITAAVYGVLAGHAIASAVGSGLGERTVAVWCSPVMILVLLSALRYGSWQGPVVFSAADVSLLLGAPLAVADLVRPRLSAALAFAAAAGAIVGTVLLLTLAGGPARIGASRSIGEVVAWGALGVLAAAGSWMAECSRAVTRAVIRASPAVAVLAVALAVAADHSAAGRLAVRWSGPWGWVTAPLTVGSSAWVVGIALVVGGALAAGLLAVRSAGAASREQFLARAEARDGVVASVTTLNYRSAVLTYRGALRGAPRPPRHLRRPRRGALVVPWRDTLALIRDPSRASWAALLSAGGTWLMVANPDRVPAAIIGVVALYLAATLLCEPLRVDVDQPDKSLLLLSRRFGRVFLSHAAVPIAGLAAVASLTLTAAVVTGTAGAEVLALIPLLAPALLSGIVLSAANATLRGGRVDGSLLVSILGTDASNPAGTILVVLWLAPWLIADVAVYGALTFWLGHAAAHGRGVTATATGVIVISLAAAVTLARRALSAAPPE